MLSGPLPLYVSLGPNMVNGEDIRVGNKWTSKVQMMLTVVFTPKIAK